jgi:hypothetical protein
MVTGSLSKNKIKSMKKALLILLLIELVIPVRLSAQTNVLDSPAGQTVETIVCIRHGEKPPAGLGQLDCRGLNRALALPDVLLKKFGAPQYIFAPDPNQMVDDRGKTYSYVRPLITIEPTAIRCGLPVNTKFGYLEIGELEKEFNGPQYQNATIFVAWEHILLEHFARNMLADNGDNPQKVPSWKNSEYDMIFVFKITRRNGHKEFSFTIDHEGLNGLSDTCPSG